MKTLLNIKKTISAEYTNTTIIYQNLDSKVARDQGNFIVWNCLVFNAKLNPKRLLSVNIFFAQHEVSQSGKYDSQVYN